MNTANEYLFLAMLGAIIFAAGIVIGAGIQQRRNRARNRGVKLQPIQWERRNTV